MIILRANFSVMDSLTIIFPLVKMETSENATDDKASPIGSSEAITWCVIFSLEALVAQTTNAVVITVFLKNTRLRKQTSILLVNLAVADLLVGIVAIPGWVYFLGAQAHLWNHTSTLALDILYSSLDIAGAFASVTNHGCIAVERLIATLLPFKYRRRRKKIITQLIAVVWICALVIPALTLVGFYVLRSKMFAFFVWMPFLSVLLLVIAVSYSILLCRVKMVTRDLQQETERHRNHRFTVTAFIVTVVSLIAWLPFMIMSAINLFVPINQDLHLVNPVKVLHFFNSMCSILIYWFRIPHFKDAACTLVFRRKRQQPERGVLGARSSSNVHSSVHGEGVSTSL